MKKNEEFEKYIMKIINEYIPVLLLQRHTFSLKAGCTKKDNLFECKFSYPYLNVIIGYSYSALKDWEKEIDLKEFIVHEMCHAITDPLYDKAFGRFITKNEVENEREMLTDHICNIALGIKNNEH